MYELDYNPEAVVDDRCIYFPSHGTKAERDLYREICDNHGWVRGDYTLTEYLNDVTKENPQVLAEYGRNYCSMTVYTYGNERISATTFNGYGYHFGCHDNGYHDIFHSYLSWHTRWKIQDPWHHNGHHNGHRSYANAWYYGNPYHFTNTYGHHSFYHRGDHCGHQWKTAMSKIYYLYDGHGSVERVHGKDGSTFRMEYDTYGNLVAGIVEKWHVWYSDIFAHRTVSIYAYSGERYNCVSQLQYLRARWYDTDTGRFISEDSYLGTLENPLSRNRYVYTNNNPVNYVDPSGHKSEKGFWEKVGDFFGDIKEAIKNAFSAIGDFFKNPFSSKEKDDLIKPLVPLEPEEPDNIEVPITEKENAPEIEETTSVEEDMGEATTSSETIDCEVESELDAIEQITLSSMIDFGWYNIDEAGLESLKTALRKYGIVSKPSIILFLATCAAETSYGTSILEIGDNEHFKEGGYDESDRGVGYIQLTHKESQLQYIAYMENVKDGAMIYDGDNTAEYIAEHYDPWDVSAYVWAKKTFGDNVIMNNYIENNYDPNITEDGNLFEIFLVTQYFINSYKKDIDSTLRGIRQGTINYEIDMNRNQLISFDEKGEEIANYELPNRWTERKEAYGNAIQVFRP